MWILDESVGVDLFVVEGVVPYALGCGDGGVVVLSEGVVVALHAVAECVPL